jgi:hypothetical protein
MKRAVKMTRSEGYGYKGHGNNHTLMMAFNSLNRQRIFNNKKRPESRLANHLATLRKSPQYKI